MRWQITCAPPPAPPRRLANEAQRLKAEVYERMGQVKDDELEALEWQRQVGGRGGLRGGREGEGRGGRGGGRERGGGRACKAACVCARAHPCAPAPPSALAPTTLPRAPPPPHTQSDPCPRFVIPAAVLDVMRREGVAAIYTTDALLRWAR